ncbi:hypothetical protein ACWD0Z_10305 [Streptomyces sp. NPDC003007]
MATRYAAPGTGGQVGRTLGERLVEPGHEVRPGSRTRDDTAAVRWSAAGPGAGMGTFAEAAEFGQVVVNAAGARVALTAREAEGRQTSAGSPRGRGRSAAFAEGESRLSPVGSDSGGERTSGRLRGHAW